VIPVPCPPLWVPILSQLLPSSLAHCILWSLFSQSITWGYVFPTYQAMPHLLPVTITSYTNIPAPLSDNGLCYNMDYKLNNNLLGTTLNTIDTTSIEEIYEVIKCSIHIALNILVNLQTSVTAIASNYDQLPQAHNWVSMKGGGLTKTSALCKLLFVRCNWWRVLKIRTSVFLFINTRLY
jgi:hypothetical protein